MQHDSVAIGQQAVLAPIPGLRHFGAGNGFAVHAAHSHQHRHQAGQLVQRRYAQRGYQRVSTAAESESQLVVLSASDALGQTLGTLGVRFDSPRGLNADIVFPDEVGLLRQRGHQVCEFTQLALDAEVASKRVLAALFHSAYLHAYRLRGVQSLVIEVNPRHVPYYRRMLDFKVCSEERLNLCVQAPAVLMSLDFGYVEEQIARYGGRPELSASVRSLYPYSYSREQEAEQLAILRAGSRIVI